jgi:hypothetical protein
MRKLVSIILLFSTISFLNCGGNTDKFANEMAVTDSLRDQLFLAFDKYNVVDTNRVLNIYQELQKTEKFAGLALNFQAIEKLKSDIKLTMNSDRLIRKQVKITDARLKGLKQSLRHREQSELTFDTHIKQAKKEVDDLRKFEEMIADKLNSWTRNTDSLYSTLR